MERAKELVPRDFQRSIVHFEITVVHLVVEITQMQALAPAGPNPFEAGMGGYGIKAKEHQMTDQVHGMGWDNEMDQRGAEIKQVFNRVHGQAGPRPDIGISMMQRMKTVEKVRMQRPVNPIEIEALPNRYQEEDRDKPHCAVIP